MPASFSPSAPRTAAPGWLEVWLEAGREGRTFTYANPEALDIGVLDHLIITEKSYYSFADEGLI